MQSLPHATTGEQTKNLWNKIRQNTKHSLTSRFNNLSLSSEHDGDSESSTIIHNALINYYTTRQQAIPSWLDQAPQQYHTTHSDSYGQPQQQGYQAQPQQLNQSQYQRNTPTSGGGNERRPSNSLRNIYKKSTNGVATMNSLNQTGPIPSHQQQHQQQRHPQQGRRAVSSGTPSSSSSSSTSASASLSAPSSGPVSSSRPTPQQSHSSTRFNYGDMNSNRNGSTNGSRGAAASRLRERMNAGGNSFELGATTNTEQQSTSRVNWARRN